MFKLATKKKSKLRLAIMGVSGSGKTYSSLSIATGLGAKIAFIDTEEGSASKYSDRFKFLVKEVTKADVDTLISIIDYVNKSDIEVLIIDSLSHAWQELLEDIDKLAKTKYQGNSFRAWGEGTPKQKKLVKAILQCKAHVIVTMRAKTEYVLSTNDKGKSAPQKVGMGAEQGKGIEYEFDMLIDLSQEHIAHVTKDRTGKFQDAMIEKPGKEFGTELKKWLDDGIDKPEDLNEPEPQVINDKQRVLFCTIAGKNGWIESAQKELLDFHGITSRSLIPVGIFQSLLDTVSVPYKAEATK